MKTAFRRSFSRDLRRIREASLHGRIQQAIEQVEKAQTLEDVQNLTKLSGGGSFYRIRIGDYRLGLVMERDEVEFVRCLHRREIYRFFP